MQQMLADRQQTAKQIKADASAAKRAAAPPKDAAKVVVQKGEPKCKRPASAAEAVAVLKRPASAVVHGVRKSPTVADLPKGFKLDMTSLLKAKLVKDATSKGAYTSKAAAMGKSQASKKHLDHDNIVMASRVAYGLASSYYEDHA